MKAPAVLLYVDGWKEIEVTSVETGAPLREDAFEGQEALETTLGEKCLGDHISYDGKNDLHIASRRNKGIGLVN